MTANTVELDALAAGDDVATDLIATKHYQQVKLVGGAIDDTTPIQEGAGTATGALRTTLASDDPAVALLGTMDTDTGVIASDTTSIDGKLTVGAGTEAAAVRVTLPTDCTGVLSVDDNGGSLTVDGTVTETNSTAILADTAAIQTAVETIDNTVKVDNGAFTLTTDSVNMAGAIRDDSLTTLGAVEGDAVPLRVGSTGALHVTGAGGGTQYTVDDPTPSVVTMAGAVRDDSLTTLTEIDGDATMLRVSSTGQLHVTGGGAGTEYTEDVASANPVVGSATMMERDDALSTLTPIEGDWASLRCSAEGAMWTQDFNSDAMALSLSNIDTSLNNVEASVGGNYVDDAVFTLGTDQGVMMMGFAGTQSVDANDAAALACTTAGLLSIDIGSDSVGIGGGTQYTEDAVAAADPVGNATILVREDAPVSVAADGDNVALRGTAYGAAYSQIVDSSGSFVDTFGGGTQYSVDDAAPTVVTMAGAVRDDSLTTLTEVDGDATLLRVSSTGALHVTGGGGGTEYSEDVATPATIVGTATMIERDDVLTATPIEGDWLGLKGSAEGALWTQDFNSDAILVDTGTIAGDTTSLDSKVTACNTGAVVISSGTVTANLSATDNAVLDNIEADTSAIAVDTNLLSSSVYVEDAAAAANEGGGINMLIREDARAGSLTSLDGDFVAQRGNNSGEAYVIDTDANALLTTIDVDTGVIAGDTTSIDGKITACNTGAVVLAAGTAGIGKLTANSGVDIGDVDITSIAAGSNLVGDVGIGVRTSGGTTLYKNIDVDESEDQVKGSGGQVYWIHAINTNAALRYLKFYNATAASVTVGTTVPDLTFPVPASATGAGFTLSIPAGIAFGTAITIAATTGVADADSGAPGANEIIVNLGYA